MRQPWIEHDKRRKTWVVRWENAPGKEPKFPRDTFIWDNAPDADKRLTVLMDQRKNNALGNSKQLPFDEAADTFLRIHGPRFANDAVRENCRVELNQLKKHFKQKILNSISYQDIVAYWNELIARGLTRGTVKKYVMLLHNIFERFKFWNGMVPDVIPEMIALPALNPVSVAMEYLGSRRTSTVHMGRKRRIKEEELSLAKAWCLKSNLADLWEDIELGLWTALRKGDQKKLEAGKTVNLVQGKTGQPQVMPIMVSQHQRGYSRQNWNRLRKAMGWLKRGTPLHTTWHDLRHCAPSWLRDGNFTDPVIQQYLGHTIGSKASAIYTHESGVALIPAVNFIKAKLEAL